MITLGTGSENRCRGMIIHRSQPSLNYWKKKHRNIQKYFPGHINLCSPHQETLGNRVHQAVLTAAKASPVPRSTELSTARSDTAQEQPSTTQTAGPLLAACWLDFHSLTFPNRFSDSSFYLILSVDPRRPGVDLHFKICLPRGRITVLHARDQVEDARFLSGCVGIIRVLRREPSQIRFRSANFVQLTADTWRFSCIEPIHFPCVFLCV